ncbi:MAG: hypothetical protein WKF67_04175, partial [Rubrobacteraceae bacterium]
MHAPDVGEVLPQRKIGSILVSEGMVTGEQLEEAVEIQKTDPRYLGAILVSMGYLRDEDLARALGMRLNVEYVDLANVTVEQDVLGIISEDVLQQHKAVPLRIENGRLIVVMSEPNDIYAMSDLTISAGYPVTPVISSEAAVGRLQNQLFGPGVDTVESAVAELAEAMEAARASGFTSTATGFGPQGNGIVDAPPEERQDAPSEERPERVEPGAQPEVDLGEPVVESGAASASEIGFRQESGDRTRGKRSRVGVKGKIGEILVSEGKITDEQLDQALSMQKSDPRDLGKILVTLGYILPADLAQALAKRLKLDYVVISELSEDEVDPEALNFINEEALRKYMALPLRFESGKLVVAMANPNDIFALEDLRIIARQPICPVVATEEDLKGAFDVIFGASEDLYPEEEPTGTVLAEPLPSEEIVEVHVPGSEGVPLEEPASVDPQDNGGSSLARVGDESRGRRVAIGGGRIGDILIKHGKITEEQLEQALMMQKDDPRELGQLLLSLGHINKTDLARALAQRLRLDFIELTERDVDKGVATLVEQKVLRKHGVVPLRLE